MQRNPAPLILPSTGSSILREPSFHPSFSRHPERIQGWINSNNVREVHGESPCADADLKDGFRRTFDQWPEAFQLALIRGRPSAESYQASYFSVRISNIFSKVFTKVYNPTPSIRVLHFGHFPSVNLFSLISKPCLFIIGSPQL
jgi:hypothetical protein